MDRQVAWTEAAWNDAEQILIHIAKDSSHYAAAFAREILDAARSLSHFADRGRVVPEFENPNIREIFVRSYRLIYSTAKPTIYFLGLIHGARDLEALWKREGRP